MLGSSTFRNLDYRQGFSTAGTGVGKLYRRTARGDRYAHILLAIEPLRSGGGIEFVEQFPEESWIPENFLPHIVAGCQNAAWHGLWGFPLADFRVRVFDASYHHLDTSNAAFREAANDAMIEAMRNSAPFILEPLLKLKVGVPEKYLAAISQDMKGRRAETVEIVRGKQPSITVSVPQSEIEISDYLPILSSLSDGTGISFVESYGHHQQLPNSLVAERY